MVFAPITRSCTIDGHVRSPRRAEKRTEPGPLRSRAQVSPGSKRVLPRHLAPSLAFSIEADCVWITRHGWGITPNPSLAITYLSQAAANAADIEAQALGAGMKKGGAAKGELVLAIYELVRAGFRYYSSSSSLGKVDNPGAVLPADDGLCRQIAFDMAGAWRRISRRPGCISRWRRI